ncbi:MAG: lamin tail domain-containing protein, partial [Akkermansiaceae bacterium]|nr:lamin tail domain-containing protein [Akkermansiaceae bacterium]
MPDITEFVQNLRISEFMYHPPEPAGDETAVSTNRDDFEFVELKNVGPSALDLRDVRFTKGINFEFAGSAVETLEPGAFVLVVSNLAAFEARYGTGLPVAGEYPDDNLRNGGERLKLSFGAGIPIQEIEEYSDSHPWPESADGGGHSLVLVGVDEVLNPDHSD